MSLGHLARPASIALLAGLALLLVPTELVAHAIAKGDKGFILCSYGVLLGPFTYLGAKHMVTGYDHLLFLVGVIFFLYRVRDIALYVTLFALGHSITLIAGVLAQISVNPYLIDAIIGASVAYKALDNIGALHRWFGFSPNAKAATMMFGLCHGLGLATKLIDFEIAGDGLIENLIAFNVGVEIGQLLALGAILIGMSYWRRRASFMRHAYAANIVLLAAGVALVGYQLVGFARGTAG
jgi:hypothetical protein